MKSFDDWYLKAGYLGDDCKIHAKCGFEAGQQIRQAETGELQKRIDGALIRIEQLRYSSCDRMIIEIGAILKGKSE